MNVMKKNDRSDRDSMRRNESASRERRGSYRGNPKDERLDYNDPAYYNINRKEFAHGQSENMNPGMTENYNEDSFRGFRPRYNAGRDYEQNIGYRENYNRFQTERSQGSGETEWRQDENGLHRGKGPRNYQRKDDRILEDINDRLCDNPYVDASEVEVSVANGEVTLIGTVEDRSSKRMIEDIGESVSGVKNIENRLKVKVKGI
jgi:osmotically-inducible protein OsmY